MSLSCYVYYRVAADKAEDASKSARELMSRLDETLAIRSRLMTRLGEPLLWMEVYENIEDQDQFLLTMNSLVNETGVDRYLASDSKRHAEMFRCA